VKFDDLISTIDLLSDEQIDEVVDWQLAQSPAAHVEQDGGISRSWQSLHGDQVRASVARMPIPTDDDPLPRTIETIELVQGWLDTLLSVFSPIDLPALDINLWRPGDQVNDRCAQCQRYLPDSTPDPDTSRPGYLFCDECAVFNP
jgi:hypothetical protein